MNPKKQFYEQQSKTLIANLKKRQMAGFYCSSKEEAVELAKSLIQENELVSFGGSMTLEETGMKAALRSGNYRLLDREACTSREEINDLYHEALKADTYFMSTNGISLDGHLVNIDGNGNRVAALIFGPKQVIIMAGMNKVASDLDSTINRVRNFSAPPNNLRLGRNTPCSKTGFCNDCQSEDCICSNTVITRRSGSENRIKVILIGEELGY